MQRKLSLTTSDLEDYVVVADRSQHLENHPAAVGGGGVAGHRVAERAPMPVPIIMDGRPASRRHGCVRVKVTTGSPRLRHLGGTSGLCRATPPRGFGRGQKASPTGPASR